MKKPSGRFKVATGNTWKFLQQEMQAERVEWQRGAGTLTWGASPVPRGCVAEATEVVTLSR